MAGYVRKRFTRPQAVTHPSSNRAQCRLTRLFQAHILLYRIISYRCRTQRNTSIRAIVDNFAIFQRTLSVEENRPRCRRNFVYRRNYVDIFL